MNVKHKIILVGLFALGCSTISYAEWHPLITLGLGSANTTKAGEAQNFPIQNPNADEAYSYSPNHSTQSSTLLNSFFGIEYLLSNV